MCVVNKSIDPTTCFRLYDSSQPNEFASLIPYGNGLEREANEFINTDSIAFPLQVNASKINADLTISNGSQIVLKLIISEDVYLSRACGFQTTFQIHTIQVDQPPLGKFI